MYTVADVQTDRIHLNPEQHRLYYDKGRIAELVASIRDHGFDRDQAITVRPDGNGGFQIVAGHRRYLACAELQRKTVPAIVRTDLSEIEALDMEWRTNLHDRPNAVSEGRMAARFYHSYRAGLRYPPQRAWRMTVKRLSLAAEPERADKMTRQRLRLTALPVSVQTLIERGKVGLRDAQILTRLYFREAVDVDLWEPGPADRDNLCAALADKIAADDIGSIRLKAAIEEILKPSGSLFEVPTVSDPEVLNQTKLVSERACKVWQQVGTVSWEGVELPKVTDAVLRRWSERLSDSAAHLRKLGSQLDAAWQERQGRRAAAKAS